ncbi:unnamed protein product, partial [Musa textilis]
GVREVDNGGKKEWNKTNVKEKKAKREEVTIDMRGEIKGDGEGEECEKIKVKKDFKGERDEVTESSERRRRWKWKQLIHDCKANSSFSTITSSSSLLPCPPSPLLVPAPHQNSAMAQRRYRRPPKVDPRGWLRLLPVVVVVKLEREARMASTLCTAASGCATGGNGCRRYASRGRSRGSGWGRSRRRRWRREPTTWPR